MCETIIMTQLNPLPHFIFHKSQLFLYWYFLTLGMCANWQLSDNLNINALCYIYILEIHHLNHENSKCGTQM